MCQDRMRSYAKLVYANVTFGWVVDNYGKAKQQLILNSYNSRIMV